MNHFAHAWVACRRRPEPRFLLGAMLPDLLGFLRLGAPEPGDPAVAAGMAFHRETDAVFHALPAFREANRSGARALRALGLRRGPARAAAHVGLELMLDAVLAQRAASTLRLYRSALAEHGCLGWPGRRPPERFAALAARLMKLDPAARATPRSLGERTQRTLATRPRLALHARERQLLETWMESVQPAWSSQGEALAQQTLAALDGRSSPWP